MRAFAVILVLMLAAAESRSAPTTPKAARPTEAIGQAGCVRAECHADIHGYAVLHGPVGVNACDACHELTDAEAHTFRLTRQKAELCTYCHEFDVRGMPLVHKPVAQGECLGCHDPHGGSTKQLVREASIAELCNRCHEPITRGRSVLHTPVMKGACDSCHPPHASRFPKLLDAVGPDLCLACHGDFEARMASVKFTHKAMESGCQKCHDVHGSNHRMATTQPVGQQCAGCHQEVIAVAAGATVKHPPVTDERACMNCHTPHGSALDKLVNDVPAKICANCHTKEIKGSTGAIIAAMPDVTAAGRESRVHGAMKNGRCAGCHGPHGTGAADLLMKVYSTRFYQSFSPERYELCFSCHDPALAQQPATTTATDFRNGTLNLHFVHVKLQGERGENCRVCHETHAGGGARGVRHRVRFGTWDMPIRFTKTETGGACFPGCHPRYAYDRVRPPSNSAPQRSPPSVARAAHESAVRVELQARSVAGPDVHVPDSKRPTVLVLARAGQEESERALKRLPAAAPDGRELQLVAILTGPDATRRAQTAPLPWPVIIDSDGRICAELDVHGWPTAVVIAPDGTELARVGGTANSLALKLAAYVDLAAGRLDRSTAERRATTRTIVVGDRTVERRESLNRDLDHAERLIAAGQYAEAKQVLTRILPRGHTSSRGHYLTGLVFEREQNWQAAAAEYRAMRDARE